MVRNLWSDAEAKEFVARYGDAHGEDLASFGAAATYDHADATGFIRLFGLPLRAAAAVSAEPGKAVVDRLIEEVAEVGAV